MDYNATTPVDPSIIGVFEQALRQYWQNPSSLHTGGLNAWELIESSRKKVAGFFNINKEDIFFSASGSEAIHAGITGYAEENNACVITTPLEHHAILNLLQQHEKLKERHLIVKTDQDGKINLQDLETGLKTGKKFLIALSPVNHETGSIQPVKDIFALAKKYKAAVLLDVVQAAVRLDVSTWVDCCDMFAVSGHKLYAPKGSGFLCIKDKIKIKPFRYGGSQENGIFPGTENVPAIAAFAESLVLYKKIFDQEIKRMRILTEEGFDILQNGRFGLIKESPADHVPGILCISLPWVKNMEKLIFALSDKNICLTRFSACTTELNGPSEILTAMGRDAKRASTSVRISLGKWSKRGDFFILRKVLEELHKARI